jgi:hypothetical protein
MYLRAASVVHMFGQLPTTLYVRVNVAHHARSVGGKINGSRVHADYAACAQQQPQQKENPFPFIKRILWERTILRPASHHF